MMSSAWKSNALDKADVGSRAPPLALPTSPPPAVSVEHVAKLQGHGGRVWCVAWSPLDNTLLSCSSDGTMKLWGCVSTRQAGQTGFDSRASTTPFSSASSGGCNTEWVCVHTLAGEHTRTVRHVSWSPSASYIACASFDHTVSIWRRTCSGGSSMRSRDCSNAQDSNVDAALAGSTMMLDVGGEMDYEVEGILDGHESEVKCVSWLTDAMLVTSSRDRNVWIWERVEDGEYECAGLLSGHTQDVKFCGWVPTRSVSHTSCLSSRSRVFSCSYDNTIKIWGDALRQDDWHCVQTLTHHSATVWAAAFQRVEECSIQQMRMDELAEDWGEDERSDANSVQSNTKHSHDIDCRSSDENTICAEKDAKTAVPQPLMCTCSDDLTVAFWALDESDKFICLASCSGFCERSIYSVDWAVGGAPIVGCASGDNSIALLGLYQDSNRNHEVHVEVLTRVPHAHDSDVNCIAFSHTGTLMQQPCANKDGTLDDGAGKATLCPDDPAHGAGSLFATGGDDHVVHVWRARL